MMMMTMAAKLTIVACLLLPTNALLGFGGTPSSRQPKLPQGQPAKPVLPNSELPPEWEGLDVTNKNSALPLDKRLEIQRKIVADRTIGDSLERIEEARRKAAEAKAARSAAEKAAAEAKAKAAAKAEAAAAAKKSRGLMDPYTPPLGLPSWSDEPDKPLFVFNTGEDEEEAEEPIAMAPLSERLKKQREIIKSKAGPAAKAATKSLENAGMEAATRATLAASTYVMANAEGNMTSDEAVEAVVERATQDTRTVVDAGAAANLAVSFAKAAATVAAAALVGPSVKLMTLASGVALVADEKGKEKEREARANGTYVERDAAKEKWLAKASKVVQKNAQARARGAEREAKLRRTERIQRRKLEEEKMAIKRRQERLARREEEERQAKIRAEAKAKAEAERLAKEAAEEAARIAAEKEAARRAAEAEARARKEKWEEAKRQALLREEVTRQLMATRRVGSKGLQSFGAPVHGRPRRLKWAIARAALWYLPPLTAAVTLAPAVAAPAAVVAGAAAVVTSKIRSKKGAVEAEGMGADDDLYAKVDAALPLEVKRKKQRVVEEEREVAEQ